MRVALIDDDKRDREKLAEYIMCFAKEAGTDMDVFQFSSGDEFLGSYKKIYDIIVFDIDMPGTDGIECARRLRKKDADVVLIFVTNMAQYAINGYEVEAVDYIIKPISYYDFSMKFYRTVAKAAQKKEHILQIDTTEGIRRLRISAIVYAEVISHYIYLHTVKNTYKVRGSMKELEEELKEYSFQRIHRCYLLNLKYVEKIRNGEVTAMGNILPVGRGYRTVLKQEYMRYVSGELKVPWSEGDL